MDGDSHALSVIPPPSIDENPPRKWSAYQPGASLGALPAASGPDPRIGPAKVAGSALTTEDDPVVPVAPVAPAVSDTLPKAVAPKIDAAPHGAPERCTESPPHDGRPVAAAGSNEDASAPTSPRGANEAGWTEWAEWASPDDSPGTKPHRGEAEAEVVTEEIEETEAEADGNGRGECS